MLARGTLQEKDRLASLGDTRRYDFAPVVATGR